MIYDVQAKSKINEVVLHTYNGGQTDVGGADYTWISVWQGPGYMRHGGGAFNAVFGDGSARAVLTPSEPRDWVASKRM